MLVELVKEEGMAYKGIASLFAFNLRVMELFLVKTADVLADLRGILADLAVEATELAMEAPELFRGMV